jgi:hypothetical protein
MSMHITALVREQYGHIGESVDLGYWEGDPPAIGDLVLIADYTFAEVVERAWTSWVDVHLLVVRTNQG